jgi:hypothetical protein
MTGQGIRRRPAGTVISTVSPEFQTRPKTILAPSVSGLVSSLFSLMAIPSAQAGRSQRMVMTARRKEPGIPRYAIKVDDPRYMESE